MAIFIGIVILFIMYSLFKAKSQIRSAEFGKEARYIAVNELDVPEQYFMHIVTYNIDTVKNIALALKEKPNFSSMSWPRLMAYGVGSLYYKDCKDAFYEHNHFTKTMLNNLGIDDDEIRSIAQNIDI
nr:hypothetical protein [Moraxella sp. CTOTU47579]